MKQILLLILALLTGLIGEEADPEVLETLQELERLINELKEEEETGETAPEQVEIVDKITNLINKIVPKIENSTKDKAGLTDLKKQISNLQKIQLNNSISRLQNSTDRPRTTNIRQATPYTVGQTTRVQNLLTIDENLIPTFVSDEVVSNMPDNENFIGELNYIGNYPKYAVPTYDYDDNEATQRAGAWAGNGADKEEQVINLTPKNIVTQPLYKLAGISWELLRLNNGMLPRFRTIETMRAWLEEYMRAVVVGDGRTGARHITSLVPIKRAASDAYVTVITPTAAPTIQSVRTAIATNIKKGRSSAILVANAATINALQEVITPTGIVDYLDNASLAAKLKIKAVYENDHMPDNEIAVFSNYTIIGDASPLSIEAYEIKQNVDYYELIGLVGGDLTVPQSAIYINAPTP